MNRAVLFSITLAIGTSLAQAQTVQTRVRHAAPVGEKAAARGEFQWPHSKAGAAARAFFAMIADSTDDSVRAFETTYRTPEALKKIPIEERITRARDLRARFGPLTPVQVVSESDSSLTIAAESGAGNEIELEFSMDAGDPSRLLSISLAPSGAPGSGVAAQALSDEDRVQVVEQAAKAVADNYVYPDVGAKMAEKIRANLLAGAYGAISDERKMASRLTEDLRSVSKDKHLAIRLAPTVPDTAGGTPHRREKFVPEGAEAARTNYEFKKVEVLPGNFGYIKFDLFLNEPEAKKVVDAAMAFLGRTDAIIFDLRENGGGDPEMVRYITSYLFDAPTHLNSMLDRSGKVTSEFRTGDVGGTKFRKDLPVFVLTSSTTFSGAEEFAYNLKALKRATIVGETTGGGAHPVSAVRMSDRFIAAVPFARAKNPITGTNWEGVGVEPDVKTESNAALEKAVGLARSAGRK